MLPYAAVRILQGVPGLQIKLDQIDGNLAGLGNFRDGMFSVFLKDGKRIHVSDGSKRFSGLFIE